MQPARIAELLHPFLPPEFAVLSAMQLQGISTYIDILVRWNARINLTAVRDPEEIVTRHFGESLFAARHLFPEVNVGTAAAGCPPERSSAALGTEILDERATPNGGTEVPGGRAALQACPERSRRGRVTGPRETGALAPALADLGSGAGFPGLPIKLWAPHVHVTLIESNQKKSVFLREVTRALTLTDVDIQTTRAESIATSRPASFDVVTLRAVERFDTILPVAAALVAPGGRVALLIGASQLPQARSAIPTFVWSDLHPIPLSESRILAIAYQTQPN